jgi:hypothetical protein
MHALTPLPFKQGTNIMGSTNKTGIIEYLLNEGWTAPTQGEAA